MAHSLKLSEVTEVTLHANLSYAEYFTQYNPYIDGVVYLATYSFGHKDFKKFWMRVAQGSVLYVATGTNRDKTKYENIAQQFLQRYPLFEVHSIKGLHTKAVFFEKSGRLLLGSQNIYSGSPGFKEVMVELKVPEAQRTNVIQEIFRSLEPNPLFPLFTLDDIKIHGEQKLYGLPFLPCHQEINVWDLVSRRVNLKMQLLTQEYHCPGWIYLITRYEVNGENHYFAFNRGYAYCGNLTPEAAEWLISECLIIERRQTIHPSSSEDLTDSSPPKDKVFSYHPHTQRRHASEAFWLGAVQDLTKHKQRIKKLPSVDITSLKIRRD